MKKTTQKVLALIFCLVLAIFCLAACENSDGSNTDVNNDKNLVSVRVEGSPYEIYEGAFKEARVTVHLDYDDETSDTVILTEKDLPEEYVPLMSITGEHTIEMLYRGFEISYTVIVKERYCKVTFLNALDEVVKSVDYDLVKKDPLIPPTAEEMFVDGHRFTGEFDKDFSNPSEDLTVKGIYVKNFTVEFYNGKNVLISSQKVDIGCDATEPTDKEKAMEGYVWKSWDNSFTNIQKDTKVYGVYVKDYTLIYSSEDEHKGAVSGSVASGSAITLGATITITAEANDGYIFDGWYMNEGLVSSDAEYSFTALTKNYTFVAKFKEDIRYSKGLEFTSNGDGTCYVSGIGTCTDTDIIIPPVSPEKDMVTGIGERAFHDCNSLTSINIPNSVAIISKHAFFDCDNLKSVAIPNGVISIDDYAFGYCSKLRSVIIPPSVTNIGYIAFYVSTALTEIIVDENNSNYKSIEGSLYSKDGKTLIQYAVGKRTFEIPDGVIDIAGCAFGGSSVTNIVIPDSITNIGNYAFVHCTYLTSIVIPSKVKNIEKFAFGFCSKLASITFEGTSELTNIGDHAFHECSSLTSITIPYGVTSIGNAAFNECSTLTNISFGDNSQLTSIGNSVFKNCTSLTSIVIPDGISNIGIFSFEGCSNLTSVIFKSTSKLETIGISAFYRCSNLKSIIIPNRIAIIDGNAFEYCSRLTDVYYIGNEEEWEKIRIGRNNWYLTNATIHYNYIPEE